MPRIRSPKPGLPLMLALAISTGLAAVQPQRGQLSEALRRRAEVPRLVRRHAGRVARRRRSGALLGADAEAASGSEAGAAGKRRGAARDRRRPLRRRAALHVTEVAGRVLPGRSQHALRGRELERHRLVLAEHRSASGSWNPASAIRSRSRRARGTTRRSSSSSRSARRASRSGWAPMRTSTSGTRRSGGSPTSPRPSVRSSPSTKPPFAGRQVDARPLHVRALQHRRCRRRGAALSGR